MNINKTEGRGKSCLCGSEIRLDIKGGLGKKDELVAT